MALLGVAPLTRTKRLGKIRSAGITDLWFRSLVEVWWTTAGEHAEFSARCPWHNSKTHKAG